MGHRRSSFGGMFGTNIVQPCQQATELPPAGISAAVPAQSAYGVPALRQPSQHSAPTLTARFALPRITALSPPACRGAPPPTAKTLRQILVCPELSPEQAASAAEALQQFEAWKLGQAGAAADAAGAHRVPDPRSAGQQRASEELAVRIRTLRLEAAAKEAAAVAATASVAAVAPAPPASPPGKEKQRRPLKVSVGRPAFILGW